MNREHRIVRRGEIYWMDWDPARGSQQGGRRPALIVQDDAAARNANYPLAVVVPVSSKGRPIPYHVQIEPSPSNGLSMCSFAKCEQILTVDKSDLLGLIGSVSDTDMLTINAALRRVLAI